MNLHYTIAELFIGFWGLELARFSPESKDEEAVQKLCGCWKNRLQDGAQSSLSGVAFGCAALLRSGKTTLQMEA